MPQGITNLRLGEVFVLGRETAYGELIEGAFDDAFVLEAEIVELQEKPSLPIGESGMDAFGQRPVYEDEGMMNRALIAIGKQDADLDGLVPVDQDITIKGGSSDHIILDLTKCGDRYNVGDVVQFKLTYGGLLRTMTSPYVEKNYLV